MNVTTSESLDRLPSIEKKISPDTLPSYYHTFLAYKNGKFIEKPPKIIKEKDNRDNRYDLQQVMDIRSGSHPLSKQKEMVLYEKNRNFKIKHNDLMETLKQVFILLFNREKIKDIMIH